MHLREVEKDASKVDQKPDLLRASNLLSYNTPIFISIFLIISEVLVSKLQLVCEGSLSHSRGSCLQTCTFGCIEADVEAYLMALFTENCCSWHTLWLGATCKPSRIKEAKEAH